ncbi:ubiquinol-cytochrome C chaperone family protein [Helicobacter pylori]|nr:ubiquinol-cytochrome C chaperone family protein [Helicobacter pylori]MDU9764413.1 ubiquinol-cytochrome C chaperone family protein [Helicobacter pylori]
MIVYDKDGTLRVNEELTNSTEYKRYGRDYAKYPERIAEELQRYGGNTFANLFRSEGVLYKEILCDVCDHLKVSYNEKSNTSWIEQNMLAKLLKDSLEQMSKKVLKNSTMNWA